MDERRHSSCAYRVTRIRGISLFEFAVVVTVIGILAGILLNRLHYYQELAEKSDMEYTISAIKSAMRLRMAVMLVEGHAQQFNVLMQENPMDWLDDKPRNYRGLLSAQTSARLQPGNWYFDREARSLIYVVERGEHFQANSDGQKRVRLRLAPLRNQPDRTSDLGIGYPTDSVTLSLVEPYKWF
jgi:hypothetical protein